MLKLANPSIVTVLLLCLPLHTAATAELNPFYPPLREALQNHQTLLQAKVWPTVPQGPTLQAGDADARVAALRQRLSASGDLPMQGNIDSGDRFDSSLRQAVMSFQSRHGLTVDGIVGPATLAALNTSLQNRIVQMRVNLQRMRELEVEPTGLVILINVPAYELLWLQDQRVTWRTRVQVGTPETPTPLFDSQLTQIVVNPSWVIPRSIAVEEILPRIQADPGYLAAQNIEVLNRDSQPVAAGTVEWSLLSSASFPYQLVQRPCAFNSLGRVKFVFPNEHAVYLHDTPQRILFGKSRRAFSHGCIRAQYPLDLGRRLLAADGWNSIDAKRVLNSSEPYTINLTVKPRVAIVYWTAFVDNKGVVQFRDDIYGRDVSDLTNGSTSDSPALPRHR